MKKENKEYCTECGTLKVEHLIKKFDSKTGKQLTSNHCPNLQCERGCSFVGHQFHRFWNSDECKRCGYVQNWGY